ncbi:MULTISPECIES: hypothetical protein [unclassified Pseudomonas]|uniref:hypothetical protein n=1 Tax=unclassified Pseudomonas TaxID=196821 RepID=UPI000C2FA977|nr:MULTISPECIES: hypothetical protein [unclassified Pseudomonas]MCU1737327.1 hypothetical protein [Pseudomonas sp. 20S_6.2_Bac1]
MEWKDLLKEVGVRFKNRSWLLIDVAPEAAQLRGLGANLTSAYPGVTLILDCSLEGIFQLVEALGPGISYAASLQAARHAPSRAVVLAPAKGLAFQDFKWAC